MPNSNKANPAGIVHRLAPDIVSDGRREFKVLGVRFRRNKRIIRLAQFPKDLVPRARAGLLNQAAEQFARRISHHVGDLVRRPVVEFSTVSDGAELLIS